ncbi:MAG: hypothetical protein JWL86_4487 [Rhizobium sp.]|nr:hypothetical protein [Rhizobium sp.]
MEYVKPKLKELLNESDVELKLIFPLLIAPRPYGLGLSTVEILSKTNVRKFIIGKGSEQKSYFPDFLVVKSSLPLFVIEAKSPGEDIDEAFRQARLYAAEMNALYPTGLNPLTRVMAANGNNFLLGFYDQADPVLKISYSEIDPYCEKFSQLQNFVGDDVLTKEFVRLSSVIKPLRYWKPRRLVGGASIQNDIVGYNSFGATISAELAHVFNPVLRKDRAYIAKEGYVPSIRRDRYVEPIDKVMRASTPGLHGQAKLIEDSSAPIELEAPFGSPRQLEHQVLLIIGGAGAGKTTFIDRLQETSLSKDVRDKTVWVHINMNPAPISNAEIYNFLRREIIRGLHSAYPEIDFEHLETMKAVYGVEVNRFRKGIGQILADDEQKFNQELYNTIKAADENLHTKAICHCRYLGTERDKLVVLVLDNCDKRLLNEQLLMFEAAQWVQTEFRALVVLPLRDETYDNYRDKPPLDTALKDLVFRIEPPPFHHVLVSRIQLALDQLSKAGPKVYKFDLPNGFKVDYPASDQAYYLTSIVRSIFEHDHQIRRMMDGLSGRNLRDAFELFLAFCTSGHITEDYILRIRQAKGEYVLPLSIVLTILLRKSFRFYDSDRGHLKNVADVDTNDPYPNYFSRLMVLRWLSSKFSEAGPTGLKGYFPLREIVFELAPYGLDANVIRREVEYLAKAKCVVTEDFRVDQISDDELLRLAPAGFVHLELLGTANYWGAIAEDTWFNSDLPAKIIAERIGNVDGHYRAETVLYNAREVLSYLEKEQLRGVAASSAILDRSRYNELTDLSSAREAIQRLQRSMTVGPWVEVFDKFPVGIIVKGKIVNAKEYGLFVEVDPGVSGLLHTSQLPRHYKTDEKFSIGEEVNVRVLSTDPVKRRMSLKWAAGN